MKPLVVGTREDVAGFALAGVDGVVCGNREEADRAIAQADDDTLVIVSNGLAVGGWRLAGDRPTAILPPTVVLPPTANRQPPTDP